jgi:SPP1 gp7 family putative phage head morphogenesis protein
MAWPFSTRKKGIEESANKGFFISEKAKGPALSFEGKVVSKEVRWPQNLGEAHPFDFAKAEGLYANYGVITGVIDKFVDFMVGPDFCIICKNKNAEKVCNDFIEQNQFDSHLRTWIKEALVKGNGFIELGGDGEEIFGVKVLDAKYVFVKRDAERKGNIESYNQYIGRIDAFNEESMVVLEPHQVAHLAFNRIGDSPYGLGIISPTFDEVEKLLELENSMNKLMKRCAGAPIVAHLGTETRSPTQEDVESFGKKLEYLENTTNWSVGQGVQFEVLNFGNISDKFVMPLKHYEDQLFFSYQVPEVLMGRGSIPEGLASVQMEAFNRNVKSKQAEAEKVLEQQIFRRLLRSVGLDEDISFDWGQPSNEAKMARIQRLNELASNFRFSPALISLIETEIASLLGFEEDYLKERERQEEEEAAQPRVPGAEPMPAEEEETEEHTHLAEDSSQDYSKDYSIKEWLGFNYDEFVTAILRFVRSDSYSNLRAKSKLELLAGKLTAKQVSRLKSVLADAFENGKSIRWIEQRIREEVKPGDLLQVENGKVTDTILASKENRPILIARTETTRSASEGALHHYGSKGIEKVRWLAAFSERTCSQCEGLNGKVMTLEEARGRIPAHVNCRCTWTPIVGD